MMEKRAPEAENRTASVVFFAAAAIIFVAVFWYASTTVFGVGLSLLVAAFGALPCFVLGVVFWFKKKRVSGKSSLFCDIFLYFGE
jgi:hypothetical protein